ncbi:unannotated protein [freshwater metagenome]|uniref:Unannotated protein n=1 Tax=freshwater metagenome TaxID=449393 RepID=A0A6J6R1Q2_9ZZZZ
MNPITAITPSQPKTGMLEFPVGIAMNSLMMVTKPSMNSLIGLKKYLKAAPSVRLPRIESATSPAHVVNFVFSGTGNSRVALPLVTRASTIHTKNKMASNQLRRIFFGAATSAGSLRTVIPMNRLRQPAGCHGILYSPPS